MAAIQQGRQFKGTGAGKPDQHEATELSSPLGSLVTGRGGGVRKAGPACPHPPSLFTAVDVDFITDDTSPLLRSFHNPILEASKRLVP